MIQTQANANQSTHPVPIALAFLSAPMLAWSQLGDLGSYVSLFALVPWFSALRTSSIAASITMSAAIGTLYGCIWAAWIPEALQGLGASKLASIGGLVMAAVWTKSLLFMFVGLAVHAGRTLPAMTQVALAGAAFAFGEWAFGALPSAIPVALLGHSQVDSLGIIQLAVAGGIPLLTGWIAAINCAIALWVARAPTGMRGALSLLAAWAAVLLFGLPVASSVRPTAEPIDPVAILIVQPDIPRGERWVEGMQLHNFNVVARYTDRALKEAVSRVDAVVWPENLLTTAYSPGSAQASVVQEWTDRWNTPIISGMVRPAVGTDDDLYRSSVLWIEPKRGLISSMDKERAIPIVESNRQITSPAIAELLFGGAANWPKVEEVKSTGPLQGAFELTPALCFEVLFSFIVDKRRSDETKFILNLSDEGWLSGKTLSHQLANVAAVRAIEQRLTLVRIAHGGVSTVISPFGERVLELPTDEYAHAFISIPASAPPTTTEKLAVVSFPVATGLIIYWGLGYSNRFRAIRRTTLAARSKENCYDTNKPYVHSFARPVDPPQCNSRNSQHTHARLGILRFVRRS